jgi:hypothetical protein
MNPFNKQQNRRTAQPQHLAYATLLFIGLCITAMEAAPEISFQSKTYDFGEIVMGDTAICFFSFTNTGDSTLKILDMRTTCSCAIAALEKKTYEPHETGTIKAIFYSSGRKGKVSKSVFITTNIKENRVVHLSISGHVKKTWKCEPEKVDFGEIGTRKVLIDSVEISTESTDSIQVDSIVPEPEQLMVTVIEHNGSSVKLRVKVETTGIKWRFIGVIRFYSNIPQARKIIIPVYARVSEKDLEK